MQVAHDGSYDSSVYLRPVNINIATWYDIN